MDSNHKTAVTAVNQPTREQLLARIAELEAASLQVGELTIRINEFAKDEKGNVIIGQDGKPQPGKGTIAVYGMGKFPTSLYAEQWERLLAPNNVKRILELCKSPKASRKVRSAKGSEIAAPAAPVAQQTAPQAPVEMAKTA